jgi:deoxyinosine 3'endonuclease (endonuclease V)
MEHMLSELCSVAYGLAIPMIDDTNAKRETLAYALVGHGGHASSKYAPHGNRRIKRGSKNPIYVSVGDNIALRDAVVLVAYACGVSRIPEPVREADVYGRCLLREAVKKVGMQE